VRRTAAWIVLAAATLTTMAISGNAAQVVEIRLRGHYFSAPATVIVNIAIEPDSANRKLVIAADSERFFRSSEIVLSGEGDARIHTVEFKNLPQGEYMLRAEVRSLTEVRGQATLGLTVMGIEKR
jgi:hypothetical protein